MVGLSSELFMRLSYYFHLGFGEQHSAHMGHAYEGTTADVIARFARLNHRGGSGSGIGGDVGTRPYFVTGADEHGEKIAKTAEGEGRAPIDICNKVRVCVYYELAHE